jgi:vacuolar-type H+-ATPase subunit E/Vma4
VSQELDSKMIEKIVEQRNQFLVDAKERAQRILAKAEEEHQKTLEQTNKSIEGIVGSELRAVHDRIVGRAQLEGRKKLLEARMEVLDAVKAQALEEVKALASGKRTDMEYSDHLIKLIVEADEAIWEDEYTISANKKDLEYLKKNLNQVSKALKGKKIRLSETPADIIGGVIVVNANGTKTMENTLETRLEAANGRLQTEIAEKLGVI